MKIALILLVVSISVIWMRSEEYLPMLGLGQPAAAEAASVSTNDLMNVAPNGQKPMTAEEFALLYKTDPQAYQKFLKSYEAVEEPSAVDKLMNFLARGKYE